MEKTNSSGTTIDVSEQMNYWKLEDHSLRSLKYCFYAYIDSNDNLADQLFIRHKIRVRFWRDYGKDGSEYNIVLCYVRKRDEAEFLSALSELTNKMLIMGHPDYPQFCAKTKAQLCLT